MSDFSNLFVQLHSLLRSQNLNDDCVSFIEKQLHVKAKFWQGDENDIPSWVRDAFFRKEMSIDPTGTKMVFVITDPTAKIKGGLEVCALPETPFPFFSHLESLKWLQKHLNVLYFNYRQIKDYRDSAPPIFKREDMPIIGSSQQMIDVLSIVDLIAPTMAPALILGESGTGKELIAKRIHQKSLRSLKPFVSINCAALTETLLESELFGYERGAFTGASTQKIGICELAHGGTLFLDEVGETSPTLQSKLLRFLQEGEFYRIGGNRPIRVDVRIISATNRNLKHEVKKGRFREDLRFRLNNIEISVPALRERIQDLASLCEYFFNQEGTSGLKRTLTFTEDAWQYLQNYPWPGNIRELQNLIERLKIVSRSDQVNSTLLPQEMLENHVVSSKPPLHQAPGLTTKTAERTLDAIPLSLEEVEKNHILNTLSQFEGNKTKTAFALKITAKTLYNKMQKFSTDASTEATIDANKASHS